MLLIFITGMPGAGKSIVADVARRLGLKVFSLGDVVREEARRLGLEPTMDNLLKIASKLREEYGSGAVALKLAEKLKNLDDCAVVIEGARSLSEVEILAKALKSDYVVIAVHASPRTRFERLRLRARHDDPRSWEEFVKRDFQELEFGIGSLIALADFMLVNESTREALESEALKILENVVRRKCL